MDNKKLISYVGCGLLIVAVIYFILTVLKISGDTFKLNMIEGFGGDDDEKTNPKLEKKKKAFEKAADKFFGEDEKEGQIDKYIRERKKRLEELEFILEDDKEEIIEKLNTLIDIDLKIEKNEAIMSSVNTPHQYKGTTAKQYATAEVLQGVVKKYGSSILSGKSAGKTKGFF